MEKLKNIIKKNKALTRIVILVKRVIVRMLMLFLRTKPVERKKVVFINFSGSGFGDNCKAVALKLIEKYPEADIVWATANGSEKSLPEGIRGVQYQSLSYYKEMATAGVWVNNCRMNAEIIKRKGQFYIQLWHGGVPLKKIEKDTENTLEKTYIEHAKYDSTIVDIITSSSAYFTEIVRNAFWYDGEILECGTPRLDPIFSVSAEKNAEVRRAAGLPADKKVILYVPTFRADLSTDCYRIDFEKVLEELKRKTGDEWVFAVRLHPNAASKADFVEYSDKIINVTSYPDLYELLPASDAVVSDYSSVMFEAGMLEKPVFLFATDIEAYKKDRDLYFDMKELPFVLAESNAEFVEKIRSFDKEKYTEALKAFNENMDYSENGTASDTIAERIIRHIKNG